MKEEKFIKNQLIKNMLFNLIAFGVIFSVLGIIIYSQFRNSLYTSADKELLNMKNRTGIIYKINEIEKKDKDSQTSETKDSTEQSNDNKDSELKNNSSINNTEQNTTRKGDRSFGPYINGSERKSPPNKENAENKVNPRLIYLYRNEEGEIVDDKSNVTNDENFKSVKFDKNIIDEVYEVIIDGQYRYRAINHKTERDGKTIYIQMLINVDAENDIIDSFTINLIVCIIISMGLSVIASYILSRKTLKPIILSWNKQTEFVQNASHELRTPLTIIQAKQELLLDEPQAKIIDKVEEINTSINETRRMAKLVKDLMQLAKADSNKVELNKESTPIDMLIKEVTKPFIEMAELQNKKFDLDLKYAKNLNIDKSKIHQVLVIILDNALKYTEEGNEITISTYEKDSKCVIDIKDTGIGISEEGLKHIFDRFYREDKARSRETGGSGLGLSIANHIINLHGGTIKAMHNGKKGTKIEIKLK